MRKLHLTGKDKALIAGIGAFLLIVSTVGWRLIGEATLGVTLAFAAVVILVFALEVYRRLERVQFATLSSARTIERAQRRHYEQVESLLSLFFTIRPEYPLPKTRNVAASPDLLRQMYEAIQEERPRLVVEAGSGISTLIAAYSLKHLGQGRVISLEHDPQYAEITRNLILRHRLQDIATVVHAPLKKYDINGHTWLWYDLECLELDQAIDFLFIDGPPGSIQKLSRYPALPLLFGQLSEKVTIILDDGIREDEKKIVDLWLNEFDKLSCEFIPLEKGCYVIHRTQDVHSTSRWPSGLESRIVRVRPVQYSQLAECCHPGGIIA